jgi:hypothetical protein
VTSKVCTASAMNRRREEGYSGLRKKHDGRPTTESPSPHTFSVMSYLSPSSPIREAPVNRAHSENALDESSVSNASSTHLAAEYMSL